MKSVLAFTALCLASAPALAGPDAFHPGTVIPDYGNVATIDTTIAPPENPRLSFDVSAAAEAGELNRTLGVYIYVCGQSAAYYDVATEDLLPGVDMALSAMTAHTMLQQQGYAINPF